MAKVAASPEPVGVSPIDVYRVVYLVSVNMRVYTAEEQAAETQAVGEEASPIMSEIGRAQ